MKTICDRTDYIKKTGKELKNQLKIDKNFDINVDKLVYNHAIELVR